MEFTQQPPHATLTEFSTPLLPFSAVHFPAHCLCVGSLAASAFVVRPLHIGCRADEFFMSRSEELVAGRGSYRKQVPCKPIRGRNGRSVVFEAGQRGN